ncbi:aromatic peroxygenase precursor [Coprinopsis marcescibilis]|uniref:Aromatic peroxygenase n=1 Tax=Coprinopsis marcescibilis TaxID=230819 RepID=A0A5C3KTP8_COPMA|nr:aromatic peroxygenase precursor [Coprinopsis marcescibilis]
MIEVSLPLKFVALAITVGTLVGNVIAFPEYQSLGGLSRREMAEAMSKLTPRVYQGAKLVDDKDHPFRAPGPNDQRGPCPGLNTLANHGYLPRDGVATPSQIISASMAGFNMDIQAAKLATYIGHLLDGNPVTDLLSIGGKTSRTGPDPKGPSKVSGLRTHGTFEGDASMTRGDDFFGDNFNPNRKLFDQLKEFSKRYGGGYYNLTVARELRYHRIKQSIDTNPTFELMGHRHFTAFSEAVFPTSMFVDGRVSGPLAAHLDMKPAESFFMNMRYPRGFFRASKPGSADAESIPVVLGNDPTRVGFQAGRNVRGVKTFVADGSQGSLFSICTFYEFFVGKRIKGIYPNPTGVLRRNLNMNLQFLFDSLSDQTNCTQMFPYGRD